MMELENVYESMKKSESSEEQSVDSENTQVIKFNQIAPFSFVLVHFLGTLSQGILNFAGECACKKTSRKTEEPSLQVIFGASVGTYPSIVGS
jgi:hypothetical protein